MRIQIKSIIILCVSLFFQQIAFAQNVISSEDDWKQLNLTATDEIIIPAYQNLSEATLSLSMESESFCSDRSADNLAKFKAAFYQSMDAWQAIQSVQFGPITYFNWNYRIQYWPDDRGTSGRQLTALIASADTSVLNSESFARQSVGIQGLPALERILFDEDSLNEFQTNDYLCELSQAIAANLNEISEGVSNRWIDEYRAIVLNPSESGFYENSEDLTIDYLKALQESIAKIRDLKLAPALGASYEAARIREAESWRSDYSLANIKVNLSNLQSLFAVFSSAFYPEDVENIELAFSTLSETSMALPDSLSAALLNEVLYVEVKELHDEVDALHEALEKALKNTDLYLGFNSLDGD